MKKDHVNYYQHKRNLKFQLASAKYLFVLEWYTTGNTTQKGEVLRLQKELRELNAKILIFERAQSAKKAPIGFLQRITVPYKEPTEETTLQDYLVAKKIFQFNEARLRGKKLPAKGERKTGRRWARENNSVELRLRAIKKFKEDYADPARMLSAHDLYRYFPKVMKHYRHYYQNSVLFNQINNPHHIKMPHFLEYVNYKNNRH
jgi:hypothetical protein